MAISGGPDILTDGLQLHLDAADENSYSGSGSTWYDLAGNSRNGIIQGATYSSADNGSFVFNGSTNYINCNSFVSTYNTFTNSTECFWFKSTQAGPILYSDTGATQTNSDGVSFRTLGDFTSYWSNESITTWMGAWSGPASNDIQAAYRGGHDYYIDNNWHYACWCFGSGFTKIYVDALSLSLSYKSGNNNTIASYNYTSPNNFSIGRRLTDTYAFGGNISQVSIYDRALSASEILQNYNATKGRFGL